MIVSCPSCAARYKINEAKIKGRGAKINCPKCRHRFVVFRDEDSDGPPKRKSRAPESVPTWDFRTLGLTWRVRRPSGATYDFWDLQTLRSFLDEGQADYGDVITFDNREWVVIDQVEDLEELFFDVWEKAKRGEISIAAPDDDEEEEEDEDDSDMPTTIMGKGSGLAAELSSAVSDMRTPAHMQREFGRSAESVPPREDVVPPDFFEPRSEPAMRSFDDFGDVEDLGTATAPNAPTRDSAPDHGFVMEPEPEPEPIRSQPVPAPAALQPRAPQALPPQHLPAPPGMPLGHGPHAPPANPVGPAVAPPTSGSSNRILVVAVFVLLFLVIAWLGGIIYYQNVLLPQAQAEREAAAKEAKEGGGKDAKAKAGDKEGAEKKDGEKDSKTDAKPEPEPAPAPEGSAPAGGGGG